MATKAIVQLHERSTTSALEADLQLRELGLDAQTNSLTVSSELDSVKWHILTTEHTAPSFTNGLTLSSTLIVVGASTLASLSVTGNATVGGTLGVTGRFTAGDAIKIEINAASSPFTSDQGSFIYTTNGSGSGIFADQGHLVIQPRSDAVRDIVFLTGSGTPTTALIIGGTGAISIPGTLGVTGVQSNEQAIAFSGYGTGGTGRIYRTASDGLALRGVNGSSNDFVIEAADGTDILRNTTGTTQVVFPASGGVSISSALGVTGVTRLGSATPTYATKNLSVVGSSFDGTSLQFENTDVNTIANGRAFNFGITDVSGTNGRFDLTQPGERTVLSVFSNGNVGIGSTTDGGNTLHVTGTLGVTGASTLAALSATTGTFSGNVTVTVASGDARLGLSTASDNWALGVDASDYGSFVISNSTALGTDNFLKISTSGIITISNSGAWTQFYGDVICNGYVTVGATLTVTGATTLAALSATTGAFVLPDNTATAFIAYEGVTGRSYIFIGTTNGSENITIGNPTTNPTIDFPGSGLVTFVGQVEIDGAADLKGVVKLNDLATAGAGGTDWTNETSVNVAGSNSVELTPTADSQTYRLTNPSNGQVLFVTNTHATYNIYVDGSDGSGTIQLYIQPTQSRFIRYNGTRWHATY